MPMVSRLVEEWTKKVPNKSINPDEAVAIGAARHAAAITGHDKEKSLLLDVTPLSLGVRTHNGAMDVVIRRNTKIPTSHTKNYTTYQDFQKKVSVAVYQGERPVAKDNILLGNFELLDLPEKHAGELDIEITFKIDSNGILQVSALEKSTNTIQQITISGSSTIDQIKISKIIEDAEKNKLKDESHIEEMKTLQKIEDTIIQLNKIKNKMSQLIEESTLKDVNESIDMLEELKNNLKINAALEAINSCQEVIKKASLEIEKAIKI
jgi:molecular chaperone DnaK